MREIKIFTKSNCMRAKLIDVVRSVSGGKVHAKIDSESLTVKVNCTDRLYNKIKNAAYEVLSPRMLVFS